MPLVQTVGMMCYFRLVARRPMSKGTALTSMSSELLFDALHGGITVGIALVAFFLGSWIPTFFIMKNFLDSMICVLYHTFIFPRTPRFIPIRARETDNSFKSRVRS
ncbi:hypothetical protein WG66_008839 [Moniliophthora roreri]|nr:hypothetical protein WG66_008839 [Moniliophthora roreri]